MLIQDLLQLNEEDMTVKLSKDGKNYVVTSVRNARLLDAEDGGFIPGDSIVKNQLRVSNGKAKYNGYNVRVLTGNLSEAKIDQEAYLKEKAAAMDDAYKIVEKFGLKVKSYKQGSAKGFDASLKIDDPVEGFKTASNIAKAFVMHGWKKNEVKKNQYDLSPQYNKKGSQIDFMAKINVTHNEVSVYAEEI